MITLSPDIAQQFASIKSQFATIILPHNDISNTTTPSTTHESNPNRQQQQQQEQEQPPLEQFANQFNQLTNQFQSLLHLLELELYSIQKQINTQSEQLTLAKEKLQFEIDALIAFQLNESEQLSIQRQQLQSDIAQFEMMKQHQQIPSTTTTMASDRQAVNTHNTSNNNDNNQHQHQHQHTHQQYDSAQHDEHQSQNQQNQQNQQHNEQQNELKLKQPAPLKPPQMTTHFVDESEFAIIDPNQNPHQPPPQPAINPSEQANTPTPTSPTPQSELLQSQLIANMNTTALAAGVEKLIRYELVNLNEFNVCRSDPTRPVSKIGQNVLHIHRNHKFVQEKSTLFLSSPDVLNGKWIQVSGVGAEIDPNTTIMSSFIHPQSAIRGNGQCNCKLLHCLEFGDYSHTIKVKWENDENEE